MSIPAIHEFNINDFQVDERNIRYGIWHLPVDCVRYYSATEKSVYEDERNVVEIRLETFRAHCDVQAKIMCGTAEKVNQVKSILENAHIKEISSIPLKDRVTVKECIYFTLYPKIMEQFFRDFDVDWEEDIPPKGHFFSANDLEEVIFGLPIDIRPIAKLLLLFNLYEKLFKRELEDSSTMFTDAIQALKNQMDKRGYFPIKEGQKIEAVFSYLDKRFKTCGPGTYAAVTKIINICLALNTVDLGPRMLA